MTKLFAFGALLLGVCAFMNFLVMVKVLDADKGDSDWIRGSSRLEELRANTTDLMRANVPQDDGSAFVEDTRDTAWIKGSNFQKSKPVAADKSQATATHHEVGTGDSFQDRRFPTYGTAAFARQCPWALKRPDKKRNCTIFAKPLPMYRREGISNWIGQIVAGRILAQQAGCNLLLDYSNGTNLHDVLTPFTNLDSDHPSINWKVPSGYECNEGRLCFFAYMGYPYRGLLSEVENATGARNLSVVPYYRFGYSMSKRRYLYADMFQDLERAIPGFAAETGMACALGSVFELAPTASQFEPELFSRILPTLHSKDALVMSLYIRTGQTDTNTHQEEKGGGMFASENTTIHRIIADKILKCALHLEKEHLSERTYSRVVWMVVTDSQYLKQWITESYDTRSTHYANTTFSDYSTTMARREVVTTRSRGVHTRTFRGPSTTDFAEAMIDWYLIGESDLVVSDDNSVSFGGTAALRTARPVYKPPSSNNNSDVCDRAILLHDRSMQ